MLGIGQILNRAFNSIIGSLKVIISAQERELTTRLTGVDQSSSVAASSTTIDATGGPYPFPAQDMDGYSLVDYFVDVDLAAGKCVFTVQATQDGNNWEEVPFVVGGKVVTRHEFISGDPNLVITAYKQGMQLRLVCTPDGVNSPTIVVWPERRVL